MSSAPRLSSGNRCRESRGGARGGVGGVRGTVFTTRQRPATVVAMIPENVSACYRTGHPRWVPSSRNIIHPVPYPPAKTRSHNVARSESDLVLIPTPRISAHPICAGMDRVSQDRVVKATVWSSGESSSSSPSPPGSTRSRNISSNLKPNPLTQAPDIPSKPRTDCPLFFTRVGGTYFEAPSCRRVASLLISCVTRSQIAGTLVSNMR